MRLIGIDFESTFIPKVRGAGELGPMAYAMHPDTEVFLISAYDGKESLVADPYELTPAEWEDLLFADAWVSHNRTFDKAIFHRLCQDIPALHCFRSPISATQENLIAPPWHCSADLAAYCGVKRDLATASKFMLGMKIEKSTRNKFARKTKQEIFDKLGDEVFEYAEADAIATWRLWTEYSDQFPEHERRLSEWTTEICHAGVGVDVDLLESEISRMESVVWEMTEAIPWTGKLDPKGKPYTPLSRKALEAHCASVGIPKPKSMAKDSPFFEEWVSEYGEPWAKVLGSYRSASRILDLLKSVQKRTNVRSYHPWVMPYGLKYYGGHNGRFSGDSGLNMQNMPREVIHGCNFRNIFVPRYDNLVYVISDLSQIEARVLLWRVGDEEQLEMIRGGMDLYEAHARRTMGYSEPEPLSEVNPKLRFFAKVRVLALGYATGAVKFRQFAKSTYGLELTPLEAKRQVRDFRRKNAKITRYWDAKLHEVTRGSKQDPNRDYFMPLPSGRHVCYYNVTRDRGWKAENQLGRGMMYIHGGKIVENEVSAIARDLLAEATLRIHSPRTRIVMSVHDELVVEVEERHAEELKEEIEHKLTMLPDWAEGLPVACESKIEERYCK